MKCHKCGAAVELLRSSAAAVFCPRCGTKLEGATITPQAAASAVGEEKKERAILRRLAEPFTYYWSIRSLVGEQLRHWAGLLGRWRGARQVIRLRPRGGYQTAHRDGRAWNVHIPDCCVVCGKPPGKGIFSEGWLVDNITWPLLAPIIGLALGVLLALLGRAWWAPLPVALGFLAGYLFRGKSAVSLQIRRCKEHPSVQSVPEMFAFAGSVQIRVNHPAVAQRFHERNGMAAEPQEEAEVAIEDEEQARRAKHEAALRGKTGRNPFADAMGFLGQMAAIGLTLGGTPMALDYARAQGGFYTGLLIITSVLYLLIGAIVLRGCCQLFGGGTPDFATAVSAVFSALALWVGIVLFIYWMQPPALTSDMPAWLLLLRGGGYLAGVLVFLFILPAVVYVFFLDLSIATASLVFFLQHVITLAAACALLWCVIRFAGVPMG